jgi:hypothetical protein
LIRVWVKKLETGHHSDRGSQYASEIYRNFLADNGLVGSMGRRGPLGAHSTRARPAAQAPQAADRRANGLCRERSGCKVLARGGCNSDESR